MSSLVRHPFAKMNGIGNEIVVLDLRGSAAEVTPAAARAIAAAPGLAYDQLMVIHDARTPGVAAFLRIFNNDGSLSAACGNGARCVAFWMARGGDARRLVLETDAGLIDCARESECVFTVDMGAPRLGSTDVPLRDAVADTRHVPTPQAIAGVPATFSALSMGNPHAVFFVADPAAVDLATVGPRLETDMLFPQKANISFARVASRERLVLRVWERGAGATRACGTAACASLVAAARADLAAREATVTLPGGDLRIAWRETDGHVLMSGPVELEFKGALDPAVFAQAPP